MVEENWATLGLGHDVGLVHFGISVDWHWLCNRVWDWVRDWPLDWVWLRYWVWYWVWDVLWNRDWHRHDAFAQEAIVDTLDHGVASYRVRGDADVSGVWVELSPALNGAEAGWGRESSEHAKVTGAKEVQ